MTEVPVSAPRADRLPWAEERLEALPASTRIETTAPLAVDIVAEMPAMTNGAGPAIAIEPEPWLAVALVPDTAPLWLMVPVAREPVADVPDIGPPDSQPVAPLCVEDEPATTPVSTREPAAALTEVALPVTAPVRLMEPVAPLTEAALPASTPLLTSAPVAADTLEDVPARAAKRDTVPFAALTDTAVPVI